MNERKDLYTLKDKVKKALDLDGWKNSWHLPKQGKYGDTDWQSIETYKEVRKILEDKMEDANARITFLGTLVYDEIDWKAPFRQLEDELRTIEYCILENDISPGETIQDLMEERKKIQAILDNAPEWVAEDE